MYSVFQTKYIKQLIIGCVIGGLLLATTIYIFIQVCASSLTSIPLYVESFLILGIIVFMVKLFSSRKAQLTAITKPVSNSFGSLLEVVCTSDAIQSTKWLIGESSAETEMMLVYEAEESLTSLLPHLSMKDWTKLSANQRDRFMLALTSRKPKMVLGLLNFVERAKVYSALPNVKKLAEGRWAAEQNIHLQQIAQNTLLVLQQSHMDEGVQLLRASDSTTSPEQLLRSTSNNDIAK